MNTGRLVVAPLHLWQSDQATHFPSPPAPLPQKPQGLIKNCPSHGSLHVAVPSFRRGETLKGEGTATRRLQPRPIIAARIRF